MTICIQYARPSSGQLEGEVYGLDVAINNFLCAWFRHSEQKQFICRPVDLPSFDHFKELAAAQGIDADARCVGLDPRTPQHNLSSMSCLFRPDPLIGDLLWKRRQVEGRGYAACGLVHTMSGERIARAVGELLLAPGEAGDALICPSPSIRDAVRSLWDIYGEYLDHRFGGQHRCPIETPVIPLGVDTEKFARQVTPEKRAAQRQALNAAPDEIIILFVGRLSFATKAHPLALLAAAELAARFTSRKLRIVMYGYFKPKDMEGHFRNLAAAAANQTRIDFVINGDPRFPDGLWAGADIFASLSDNVQESFGLTPVEAMACGLPVVATDWNGYRGGVRDGIDGFLIPTYTPPPESGLAIAEYYYNEQNYGVELVAASQSTVVDIGRCGEALRVLVADNDKRRAMGASGMARARATFDWRHIIKAYEDLWRELASKRRSAPEKQATPENWPAAHPAFPNPWKMFASFPTRFLTPDERMRVIMDARGIEALLQHEMNFFVPELLMPKEALLELIEIVRMSGAPRIGEIVNAFPAAEQMRIWRCIGWMLKFGICALGK